MSNCRSCRFARGGFDCLVISGDDFDAARMVDRWADSVEWIKTDDSAYPADGASLCPGYAPVNLVTPITKGESMTQEQLDNWFTVPLYGRNGVVAYAKLDHVDALLADKRWNLSAQGYAKHGRGGLLMHRAVMAPAKGEQVDHINGDKLDNRRSNLRLVTSAQQTQNRAVHRTSETGVRNVQRVPSGRFAVTVRCNGQRVSGGTFDTLAEAAEAASLLRSKMLTHTNEERHAFNR